MAELGLKEKSISLILLVVLISVFVLAGTITTVEASPKAEFNIEYTLETHAEQTRVDNERVLVFEQRQGGSIADSDILLAEDIIGGQIYFNWLAVHNKQSDVARASGTFEIISSVGVVLITGTTMAEVRGFTSNKPLVEVRYFGHGYVNLWGTTDDIGFNIDILVESFYW